MLLNVNEQIRAKSKLSRGFSSGTLGMQKWSKTARFSCECAQNKILMHKRLSQQVNRRSNDETVTWLECQLFQSYYYIPSFAFSLDFHWTQFDLEWWCKMGMESQQLIASVCGVVEVFSVIGNTYNAKFKFIVSSPVFKAMFKITSWNRPSTSTGNYLSVQNMTESQNNKHD
jgi:hypothetical protein